MTNLLVKVLKNFLNVDALGIKGNCQHMRLLSQNQTQKKDFLDELSKPQVEHSEKHKHRATSTNKKEHDR